MFGIVKDDIVKCKCNRIKEYIKERVRQYTTYKNNINNV